MVDVIPNVPDSRQSYRYRLTAEKLGIPIEEYLSKGQSGKRYCSRCLKWKGRGQFLEYSYTKSYYSGICKKCSSGKSTPPKVDPNLWGTSVRASKKIGEDVNTYITKRASGFRWCTDHKGWFDASNMIREGGPRISRCNNCNAQRAKNLRARITRSKELP